MTIEEHRTELITKIYPLLIKKGIKNLTMDSVAKSLGMSKRTLYEIFNSKEDMIVDTMRKMHELMKQRMVGIVSKASNTMEAVVLALKFHQRTMSELDMAFFVDMDEYCPRLRPTYDEVAANNDLLQFLEAGIKEGVFRPDVDYRIMSRLFLIQMESLKRMEKQFPPDVTLIQTFNTISLGFLRSIATYKGLEILEGMSNHFVTVNKNKKVIENNKE